MAPVLRRRVSTELEGGSPFLVLTWRLRLTGKRHQGAVDSRARAELES